MEAVFTLPYPEFRVANRLAEFFKKQKGFSILLPSSRTEKGFDLALLKQKGGSRKVITIQVKSSRCYGGWPWFGSLFGRFEIPDETDWIFFVMIFPDSKSRARKSDANWWKEIILCFTRSEMRRFLRNVKTVGGKPDRFFGFCFERPTKILQERGDQKRRDKDFSSYLLERRAGKIFKSFS